MTLTLHLEIIKLAKSKIVFGPDGGFLGGSYWLHRHVPLTTLKDGLLSLHQSDLQYSSEA